MFVEQLLLRFIRQPKLGLYLGTTRSLLALSLLTTFLFTGIDRLFFYNLNAEVNPEIYTVKYGILTKYSLYNLIDIEVAFYLTIIVLILVISGYFSRISSILHFYICFSFVSSSLLDNGANKISLVLTLLLIPICFLENRKNHWIDENKTPNYYRSVTLNFILFFTRIQISYIYFQAFYKKLELAEWSNGTALWYHLQEANVFSAESGFRRVLLDFVIYNDKVLVISTWVVLIAELLLSLTLFIKKEYRVYLFLIGVLLHVGIAIFLGLFSFALVMIAALILLTLPPNLSKYRFIATKD